ncbi:MAG: helix-turn-helix domain-containing protein [Gammaproteobacteria bacterium]|nr:helix-turn-helix domain-containing protein [Gammaproteobacteria bacterium]
MAKDPRDFSIRLKEAAGEAGIYSPRELARLLDIQVQTVNQWYSGQSRPNGKNLFNLLSLLRVDNDWLMHGISPGDKAAENSVANPRPSFSDAIAVLNGMAGLLSNRTGAIDAADANKIGRTIEKATRNADIAFHELHALYSSKTQ